MYTVFIDMSPEEEEGEIFLVYNALSLDDFSLSKLFKNIIDRYKEHDYAYENKNPKEDVAIFICKFNEKNLFIQIEQDFYNLQKHCIFAGTYNELIKTTMMNKFIKNPDTARKITRYVYDKDDNHRIVRQQQNQQYYDDDEDLLVD